MRTKRDVKRSLQGALDQWRSMPPGEMERANLQAWAERRHRQANRINTPRQRAQGRIV
jgi:hypothetical protein